MRWWAVFCCSVAPVACAPARPLPLPADEGALALLLIDPTAPHLLGIDRSNSAGLEPGALRSDRPLFARSYAVTLESLGLAPGRTPLVGPGPGHRPLPAGLATHRADLSTDPPSWRLLDDAEADQSLAQVFLPGAEAGCEPNGGCWITQMGQPQCVLPCPALPPLTAPAKPAPTNLPDLEPCPSTWSTPPSTLTPELRRCVPPQLV